MRKIYVFHSDAGHGWLAVKRKELIRLGILNKVTPYSYQRGGTVYLEEDCDASLFIGAKKAAGEPVNYNERYHDKSPIRNYVGFNALT